MRSCRAPIASLDCMEEFNGGGGGGGGVDSGVHCSNTTGTKEQLLTSCIAAQAQRLQHPSPGIRYRNLGKSGLRVSNVGLGTLNVFPSYHVYRESSSSARSLSARSPNASCLRRRYIVSLNFPPPRFSRKRKYIRGRIDSRKCIRATGYLGFLCRSRHHPGITGYVGFRVFTVSLFISRRAPRPPAVTRFRCGRGYMQYVRYAMTYSRSFVLDTLGQHARNSRDLPT